MHCTQYCDNDDKPLYKINQTVNVLHDGVVRKGKIITIFPQKKHYLIQLESSMIDPMMTERIILTSYNTISGNTFNQKSFDKFLNDINWEEKQEVIEIKEEKQKQKKIKKEKEEKKPKKVSVVKNSKEMIEKLPSLSNLTIDLSSTSTKTIKKENMKNDNDVIDLADD